MDRKRVITIFAVAWVSAALLSWFLYKNTRSPQQERTVVALAPNRNLAAGTLLKESDLARVTLRQREAPAGVILANRKDDAINRALLVDMTANEPLLEQKLARRAGAEGIAATIEEGKRAVAVKIDSVSGAGELLEPNARVDVIFTKPGRMSEAITTTLLQNVKVLSVGRRTRPGEKVDPKAPKVPVATLLVTPEEAQRLELAKSQGRVSLVLRNPLDERNLQKAEPVTAEVLDPLVISRPEMLRARARAKRAASPSEPDEDSPDLRKKAKPEPEPPKFVVDVFRGSKHTQEVFR